MSEEMKKKPRFAVTAFGLFKKTCREEHKRIYPEANVPIKVYNQKCADRWSTMTDEEKQRFQDMTECPEEKREFELALKQNEYSDMEAEEEKVPIKRKKQKQTKDPSAPKRGLTAFFWFAREERPRVVAANTEYGVGEVAKELGRLWASASPEVKEKYQAKAASDKARYEKEKIEYINKQLKSDVKADEQQDEAESG